MLLDTITGLIAPFNCYTCGRKGSLLCSDCREVEFGTQPSRCYRCHKATLQFQVCISCRRTTPLQHVWICSMYEGVAKELIEALKFERARSASTDIAAIMASALPLLPRETFVCPIPTAPSRIRVRGYDQAVLLAKAIAKHKKLPFERLLIRVSSARQVGSGRKERFIQAEAAFMPSKHSIKGKQVLIVDDVTTSGATIEAAAKILKKAGAKTVDAVVFAQALD